MASQRDWLCAPQYGEVIVVPALTNQSYPLMRIPDISTMDPSAFMGGNSEDVSRKKVLRIVGDVMLMHGAGDTRNYLWGWRTLSLPYDYNLGGIDTPWATTDNVMYDPELTDLVRWYEERWMFETGVNGQLLNTPVGRGAIDNPYWTKCDSSPAGVVTGLDVDSWPCLLVDNSLNDGELNFMQRIRCFMVAVRD